MTEKQDVHRLHIETSGETTRLICSHCDRPFLTVSKGEIQISSKHGSKLDVNTLQIADLLVLAGIMQRQISPTSGW